MNELIIKFGFLRRSENEYVKDNFILRIFKNEFEIYEDKFENRTGKYYKGDISKLKDVLKEL